MRDLVLLHGFTQTGRSWAPLIALLKQRYRCFAPDLPGHGDAAHRRPATFDAVAAYLNALHMERFTLVGYSMGGRLALHAATRIPSRIERLLVIGATPGIAHPEERARRRAADEALAGRIEQTGLEAFVEEWGRQELFSSMPRGVAEAAHADRLRNTPAGLATALRGMGTGVMDPLWDRLPPATWIAGERDAKFRAIAERMEDARIVCGAGHAVHLEQPEAVATLIE